MSQNYKAKLKIAGKTHWFFGIKKAVLIAGLFFLLSSVFLTDIRYSQAQGAVVSTEVASVPSITQTFFQKLWNTLKTVISKAGSKAFQITLRTALNKVAYDYATALGSGDWGQQPLFQAKNWDVYFGDLANESGGAFVEEFVNDFSEENSKKMEEIGKQESATYDKEQDCLSACAFKPVAVTGVGSNGDPIYESQESATASCQTACQKDYNSAMKPINEQKKALSSRPIATCQPSSLDVKLKISLGLAQVNKPAAPNCTVTQMVKNWQTAYDRLADYERPNYLSETLPQIFNPVSNDLGIALSLRSDLLSKEAEKKANETLQASIGQGYTDKRNIAGNLISIPNKSRLDTEASGQMYLDNFGKYTGDAFIDAANIFINQAALTAFNKLMSNLGGKVKQSSSSSGSGGSGSSGSNSQGDLANCNPLTDSSCAPTVYGEGNVQEAASSLIKPQFATQADYSVLEKLSLCVDPKNPGPTDCVIDDRFLQAVSQKQTVAEAMNDNFLNKDWLFSGDSQNSNAFNPRSISILIKYRILPLGWEEAINKIQKFDKKATLADLVSCFDPNDNYNQFGNEFDVRDQAWCEGLVDPNWVLKAPLNYCRKMGVGGQIQTTQIVPGQSAQGDIPATPSSLSITRGEEYCADEQTCIKERADGSCDAYGYCDSEKRTWSFGHDSCDPVYNTCQAFTKDNGVSASYLKNTLDYGSCNADNAGCQAYSWFGTYDNLNNKVAWAAAKQVYLNGKAGTCSAAEEGCTNLLRVKPSWGSNLVMNSGFGNDNIGDSISTACASAGAALNDWSFKTLSGASGDCQAEILDTFALGSESGGKMIHLSATSTDLNLYSDADHSLLPDNFSFLSGQSYTLSADVYLASGDQIKLWIGLSNNIPSTAGQTINKDSWQHLTFTKTAADAINDPEFYIQASRSDNNKLDFYVKNLKLEVSDYDTGARLYGAYQVYERVIPPYLEASCYTSVGSGTNDYTLKADAPSICSTFARKCNKDEAGCELYSSLDNFAIPAQVVASDYCPGECVGYDAYVSKITYFNSAASENLIPGTSRTCSATAVGCNEFTNLDTVSQGGEQKEYYSSLKQCIKPDPDRCGDFYVWRNSNESGYQLQALSLRKDTNGLYVTADDSDLCNATIFSAAPGDANYNPDCRQFYGNNASDVSYHLLSRTVSCSDDCKTFRLSEKNVDPTLSEADCNHADYQHWDAGNNVCYSCLNGGQWDDQQQACLYKAIPSEGTKCAAADNGCREYNGNRGNNLRLVASYDFENGTSDWATTGGTATSSLDSINKDGHSLRFDSSASGGTIAATLGSSLNQSSAYVIRFLAKAASDTGLGIYFTDGSASSYFGPGGQNQPSLTIRGDNDWHAYQVNLLSLGHAVTPSERLVIRANNDFRLDNLVLQEISDKYYLVSHSSQIPDICYYDMFDRFQGADYNLGCSVYTDRAKVANNLRQFSRLCQDSAVGCEMMINTQNYSPYDSRLFNDLNDNGACDNSEPDCVKIARDSIMYAVFDPAKQCNSADQGCARLGQAQKQGNNWYFTDIYKKNNPDTYDQSLCKTSEVGCSKWQDDNGSLSYFRDPGLNVCVYRNATTGGNKAWFLAAVKRCDLNDDGQIKNVSGSNESAGPVCFSDQDCTNSRKCLVDNNDYSCPVSYLKTIGYGGVNNRIPSPDGPAGLCSADASGCTEYIDPVSRFSNNLVVNPNFEDVNGDGNKGDGWSAIGKQSVALQAGKLYRFNFSDPSSTGLALSCLNSVRILGVDNNFGAPTSSIDVMANNALLFLTPVNNTCSFIGGTTTRSFELKENIVGYQKQGELDLKSCNGIADFDSGCILFNERGAYGANGPASLSGGWNANRSQDRNSPIACNPQETATTTTYCGVNSECSATAKPLTYNTCNANQLVKVRPDRVCGTWVDCTSFSIDSDTKEKTCYAFGRCDRLGDNKECASFAGSSNSAGYGTNANKNASGYSLSNAYSLVDMKEVGLQTDVHYDFENKNAALSCINLSGGACNFNKNINDDLIIIEPNNSPADYPAHGSGYLKVPVGYQISPRSSQSYISVLKLQTYYINYLINTKGSDAQAQVSILDEGGAVIANFLDSAPDGWERRVHKFNTDGNARISIALRASISGQADSGAQAVYFDDINIEPVLKINGSGDDSRDYAARECRLYPSNDSLTCFSNNDNVIKNGWEGYCLKHDPNNKKVCLLWYPADQVSSFQSINNTSGYKGTFPLNYCAELNGNFIPMEKRTAVRVFQTTRHESSNGVITGTGYTETFPNDQQVCLFDSQSSRDLVVGGDCDIFRFDSNAKNFVLSMCHSTDYYARGYHDDATSGTPTPWTSVLCVPLNKGDYQANGGARSIYASITRLVPLADKKLTYYSNKNINCTSTAEGWYPYNGFTESLRAGVGDDNATTGGFNEAKNNDPPLKIYDIEPGATEGTIKYLSAKDDGANENNVFQFACSKFVQTANEYGQNKAWADRVGLYSKYPTSTPNFFLNYSDNKYPIFRYGRSREGIPFGAAVLPSDFNFASSRLIKFRSQDSKNNNQTIFAGWPYGCTGQDDLVNSSGCGYVGYCSLDPNVFCFYSTSTDEYFAKNNGCSDGGYGRCLPIWSTSTPPLYSMHNNTESNYQQILKTLFLKFYNSFSFNDGSYVSDGSVLTSGNKSDYSASISKCSGNSRSNDDSDPDTFCAVYPRVSNPVLRFNGQAVYPANLSGDFTNTKISQTGIYSLEFNVNIDKEQQPLKSIFISWGDGSIQTVNGVDNRADNSAPHVFYHYYSTIPADGSHYRVAVRVADNWGFYDDCIVAPDNNCSSVSQSIFESLSGPTTSYD